MKEKTEINKKNKEDEGKNKKCKKNIKKNIYIYKSTICKPRWNNKQGNKFNLTCPNHGHPHN